MLGQSQHRRHELISGQSGLEQVVPVEQPVVVSRPPEERREDRVDVLDRPAVVRNEVDRVLGIRQEDLLTTRHVDGERGCAGTVVELDCRLEATGVDVRDDRPRAAGQREVVPPRRDDQRGDRSRPLALERGVLRVDAGDRPVAAEVTDHVRPTGRRHDEIVRLRWEGRSGRSRVRHCRGRSGGGSRRAVEANAEEGSLPAPRSASMIGDEYGTSNTTTSSPPLPAKEIDSSALRGVAADVGVIPTLAAVVPTMWRISEQATVGAVTTGSRPLSPRNRRRRPPLRSEPSPSWRPSVTLLAAYAGPLVTKPPVANTTSATATPTFIHPWFTGGGGYRFCHGPCRNLCGATPWRSPSARRASTPGARAAATPPPRGGRR